MKIINEIDILNAWKKFENSGKIKDYIDYIKLNNFIER